MTPTGTYLAIIAAVDRRIRALRWTMQECDDRAGLQDGFTAKMLHPDKPSGRQAQWATLDLLMQALWPGGFKVTFSPVGDTIPALAGKPVPARKGMYVPTPEMAREMGKKRWEGVSKSEHSELSRRAVMARWSRPRVVEVTSPVERAAITRALTPSQDRCPV